MSRTWKVIPALAAPILAAIAAGALWLIPGNSIAAPRDNVALGLRLSHQYCEACHIVVHSDSKGWTDAPSFEAIAVRDETTRARLASFIEKPHMHMLNTARPPAEAEAIAAYILSLRHR